MSEKPDILILTFDHRAGVTQNFAHAMAVAAAGWGAVPSVASVGSNLAQTLQAIDWAQLRCVISIGHMPLNITLDGRPIYEVVECPFYLYMLDTPIYDFIFSEKTKIFFRRAFQTSRLRVAFAEQTHRALYEACAEALGATLQTVFLPFAAFPRLPLREPDVRQQHLMVVGEALNKLFSVEPGSGLREIISNNNLYDLSGTQINRLAEVLEEPSASGDVLHKLLGFMNLGPDHLFSDTFLNFAYVVNNAVKQQRRFHGISSLAGIPVDFFGSGWDELFSDIPSFRFFGGIAHRDIGVVAQHYRGLVNFDPNWEHGIHDRVMTGLAAGAAVITNSNKMLDEEGFPRENIFTFHPNSTARERAEEVLGSTRTVEVTPDFLCKHSWTERISRVLLSV